MYRKWKGVAALGMAALIGCLMPMGTMMAAEDDQEDVQEVEAGSEAAAADNDEAILGDNENVSVEEDTDTDENVDDEINADNEIVDDEVSVDDENAGDEVSADDENADEVDVDNEIADDEVEPDNDGNDGIAVMSEAEAGDVEVQASSDAPVIDITWQGQDCKYDLGGKIDFVYVNNHNQAFECSANQDGQTVSLFYYLEKVASINSEAMGEDKLKSLTSWEEASSSSIRIPLSEEAKYVLYVKAVGADEQTTYARSGGIVVDTKAPEATKLVDGKTYLEGTTFQVTDNNLESVEVNGVDVTAGFYDSYQVSANGTSSSCVIKLKDKAGNVTIYNVNVSKAPADDGVISASGIYSLNADTSYKLGEGQWQVGGDKSVYSGGNTFYVGAGDYSFTKR